MNPLPHPVHSTGAREHTPHLKQIETGEEATSLATHDGSHRRGYSPVLADPMLGTHWVSSE